VDTDALYDALDELRAGIARASELLEAERGAPRETAPDGSPPPTN